MSILNIITYPNDILRQISKKISKDELLGNPKLQRLIKDLAETMTKKDGIGLAAPQVGHNIRLIVVSTKDGPMPMINPKITRRSLLKELGEEGCLSLPEIFAKVKRHKAITCEFWTPPSAVSGVELKRIAAKGLLARVIQHEIDHLDGILFIDRVKKK